MSNDEMTKRAIYAVASQYGYKDDPVAYAKELLAKEPQLWAASIAEEELRNDGLRVTQARKNAIWKALGGIII